MRNTVSIYSAWGFGFSEDFRTSRLNHMQQIQPLLDDPNLVMLFVNQHHNVSHPKVISVPRGVWRRSGWVIWDEAAKALEKGLRLV